LDFTKEKSKEALSNPQDFFIREYKHWLEKEYKIMSVRHTNILKNFIKKERFFFYLFLLSRDEKSNRLN
jgi:predicted metal-dependent HD superfamily phosphohydrolase